ncbi:MAG: divergent polysaccharide deacetylase family protein [Rhizobiales bacterium]|nr:divergent polysaccharide deacetylase family protein [Hyphomicrobiales bacterium]
MLDELDVPLGQKPKRKPAHPRMLRYLPHAVLALLLSGLAGFAGWTMLVDNPFGGEPSAIVSIAATRTDKPDNAAAVSAAPATPAQHPAAVQTEGESQPGQAAGVKTVTIIDGMSGKREQVTIGGLGPAMPPTRDGNAEAERSGGVDKVTVTPVRKLPADLAVKAVTPPDAGSSAAAPAKADEPAPASPAAAAPGAAASADPRLSETVRHGVIPKIGAGNLRPAEVYASALGPALAAQAGPQIAFVVGRLGVSGKATDEALAKLPQAVTLAFAPYGNNVAAAVSRARAAGREVLLQVPMEPFDYPDNDPGPQTLLTSLAADQNLDRLHWFMSRIGGYVGIGNYMGNRFAGNEAAVSTVMREVAKRGLVYFDDGTATRSLVAQVAAVNGVPFARADMLIDIGRPQAEVDAAMARLEAIARERGSAVGVAVAMPGAMDHIARWAASATSRGITLVPLSVIANKPKSS